MIGAPSGLAVTFGAKFDARIVGALAVVEEHAAQVVFIAALGVYNFSKETLAYHIQNGHDITAVTNIF